MKADQARSEVQKLEKEKSQYSVVDIDLQLPKIDMISWEEVKGAIDGQLEKAADKVQKKALEKDFEKDLEKLVEKSNERLDRTKKFKEEVAGRIDSLVVEESKELQRLIEQYTQQEGQISKQFEEIKPRDQELKKMLVEAQERKDRCTKIYDEAEKKKHEIAMNIERLQILIVHLNTRKEGFIDELSPRLHIFDDVNQTSEIFNFMLGCLYQSKKNIIEYCKENSIEPPPPPKESLVVRISKVFTCGAKKPKHDFNSEKIYWDEFKSRAFVKNNGSNFKDKISRLRADKIEPFQMMLIDELLEERKQILKDLFEIDLKDNVRILLDIVELVKQGTVALNDLEKAKEEKKNAEKDADKMKRQKKKKDKMHANSSKCSENLKKYQSLLQNIQKSFGESREQFEAHIAESKKSESIKQELNKEEETKINTEGTKKKEETQQKLQDKQKQQEIQKLKLEQKLLEEKKAQKLAEQEQANKIAQSLIQEAEQNQEKENEANAQKQQQEQKQNEGDHDKEKQLGQEDQDSELELSRNNENENMAFLDASAQTDPLVRSIFSTMFSQYVKQNETQNQKKMTQSTSMFDMILKQQKQKAK